MKTIEGLNNVLINFNVPPPHTSSNTMIIPLMLERTCFWLTHRTLGRHTHPSLDGKETCFWKVPRQTSQSTITHTKTNLRIPL